MKKISLFWICILLILGCNGDDGQQPVDSQGIKPLPPPHRLSGKLTNVYERAFRRRADTLVISLAQDSIVVSGVQIFDDSALVATPSWYHSKNGKILRVWNFARNDTFRLVIIGHKNF